MSNLFQVNEVNKSCLTNFIILSLRKTIERVKHRFGENTNFVVFGPWIFQFSIHTQKVNKVVKESKGDCKVTQQWSYGGNFNCPMIIWSARYDHYSGGLTLLILLEISQSSEGVVAWLLGSLESPLEGAPYRQETVRSDSCKLGSRQIEARDRGCRRQLFAILVATKNVHLAFNRFESPFPRSLNTHSFRFKIRGLGGPSSWNLVRLVI